MKDSKEGENKELMKKMTEDGVVVGGRILKPQHHELRQGLVSLLNETTGLDFNYTDIEIKEDKLLFKLSPAKKAVLLPYHQDIIDFTKEKHGLRVTRIL